MVSRRQTVLGLGGLLAGGGALVSTGAFDTVQAERAVSLETASDENALLSLESLDEEVVDPDAELIEFEIPGRSSVTYEDLVLVTNRGTQTVTSLRFEFVVEGAEQSDEEVEEALRIVSNDDGDLVEIDAVDDRNLIAESDAGDADDDRLEPGESIPFGMRVDLTATDIDEISGDPDVTLRIIAESGETGGDDGENGEDGSDGDGDGNEEIGVELTEAGITASTGNDNRIEFTVSTEDAATVGGFNLDIEITSSGKNRPTSFGSFSIEADSMTVDPDSTGFNVGENITHSSVEFNDSDDLSYTFEDFDQNPAPGNWTVDLSLLNEKGDVLGGFDEELNPGN